MPECNIDDIICQMQVLDHLKGIKEIVGGDKFGTSFPEFEGLDSVLAEKIITGEASLNETLKACGLSGSEEPEEEE